LIHYNSKGGATTRSNNYVTRKGEGEGRAALQQGKGRKK